MAGPGPDWLGLAGAIPAYLRIAWWGLASPLAEKLILISGYEKLNKDLILESIGGIQEGTNPRVLKQLLNAYLPESKRQEDE